MRTRMCVHTHTHTHTLKFKKSSYKKISVVVLVPKSDTLRTEEMCTNMWQYTFSCRPSHGAGVPRIATALLIGDQETEVSPPLEHAMAKLNNIEETLFSLTVPLFCLLAKILEARSNGALDIAHPGLTVLPSCPTE